MEVLREPRRGMHWMSMSSELSERTAEHFLHKVQVVKVVDPAASSFIQVIICPAALV